MNGTDLQLVCYSTFCKQYIASMYYSYKTFRQFFLALYSTQISYCFCFFNEAFCQDLVTRALMWHHNGNQDVTKEAAVTMVCGHASHSGWVEAVLWAIFCFYTPESAQIYYALRHHDRIEIDTEIEVIVVSPTTWEAHHSPRADLRPRAVVSFPGRWWHHNDLNLGINSYNSPLWTSYGR